MTEIGRQVPGKGRHRVRSITLQVTRQPDGSMGIATPQARGWGTIARNQVQLAKALAEAFTEAEVAAYSRWKGKAYDLDDGSMRKPRRRKSNGKGRTDTYSAEEWTRLDDGRWLSPGGRSYRGDSQTVARVVAKRRMLGIHDN